MGRAEEAAPAPRPWRDGAQDGKSRQRSAGGIG
jgi:hypothetical protein